MKNKKERKSKIEKIDFIIFFMILIVFGIALLGFYPAIMTSDCVDQMGQAETGNYRASHPIFHTAIIGNIAKIFGTVSASAIFQIIVFAIIWTWGCKILRSENSTFKYKLIQCIVTFIVVIIPLNFMYAITLWKDILYTYSFLALIICVYNFIRKDYKVNILDIILTSLALVCIAKFRYNGPAVSFVMFALILIINFIKQRRIKISSLFIISFLIMYILAGIPGKVLVKSNSSSGTNMFGAFNGTMYHAMGAILNTDVEIDEEDKEFLNSILELNEWKECYNAYTAANIHYNPDIHYDVCSTKENLDKFKSIFIKYAKKEPKAVVMHFIKLNSINWSIKEYAPMNNVVVTNAWISEMSNGKYDTKPVSKTINNILRNYINYTWGNRILYEIIYRPAVPLYASIILIIILVVKNKKIDYALIELPMLLNLGTYIFIFVSQDQRYFYPNFITLYFVILLYFQIKTKNKRIINLKDSKYGKTIVMIAVNNEEDDINNFIENTNSNYDYLIINNTGNNEFLRNISKNNIKVINLINKLKQESAYQLGYKYSLENGYDIAVQLNINSKVNVEKLINNIKSKKANMAVISKENNKKVRNKLYRLKAKIATNYNFKSPESNEKVLDRNLIEIFSKNNYNEYEKTIIAYNCSNVLEICE